MTGQHHAHVASGTPTGSGSTRHAAHPPGGSRLAPAPRRAALTAAAAATAALLAAVLVVGAPSAGAYDRRPGHAAAASTTPSTSPSITPGTTPPVADPAPAPASVPSDAAADRDGSAEVAAWTRVVLEGQNRVHALTGAYVPLPSRDPVPGPAPDETSAPVAAATSPTGDPTATSSSSVTRPTATPPAGPAAARGGGEGVSVVGGWYAGSSGDPVTGSDAIRGTWSDTEDAVQRSLSSLQALQGWDGAVDIAVGGTVLGSGESYAQAAAGAFDDRWRSAAAALAAARGGASGPTFVRPWHEFNGDWYPEWQVNAATVSDYQAAFARYAAILRAAMPHVVIVWSPNDGTHQDYPVVDMYPGDDVVDVIGVDSYDWTRPDWDATQVAAYLHRGSAADPSGLESWRQFALEHGKPLALPEWGLCPRDECGRDHPAYITAMHTWLTDHANTTTWPLGGHIPGEAAGTVLYSVYFNTVHDGDAGFTLPANPNAAAAFAARTWGRPARDGS